MACGLHRDYRTIHYLLCKACGLNRDYSLFVLYGLWSSQGLSKKYAPARKPAAAATRTRTLPPSSCLFSLTQMIWPKLTGLLWWREEVSKVGASSFASMVGSLHQLAGEAMFLEEERDVIENCRSDSTTWGNLSKLQLTYFRNEVFPFKDLCTIYVLHSSQMPFARQAVSLRCFSVPDVAVYSGQIGPWILACMSLLPAARDCKTPAGNSFCWHSPDEQRARFHVRFVLLAAHIQATNVPLFQLFLQVWW